MSSKAAHSCILAARSVSLREEGFHQGPAVPLMHKFVSVQLSRSGQMNWGVWWKGGKLSVLGAVHFSPRDVLLRPSLCFTEQLPNFSLAQKWHEQGKKEKQSCFLSPTPRMMPEADHEICFLCLCNGYCLDSGIHRTPQVRRDDLTSQLLFLYHPNLE